MNFNLQARNSKSIIRTMYIYSKSTYVYVKIERQRYEIDTRNLNRDRKNDVKCRLRFYESLSLISFSTLAGGHPLFSHFVSGVSDINVSLTRENDVDLYRSTSRLDLTCRLCTNICPRGANDNRL